MIVGEFVLAPEASDRPDLRACAAAGPDDIGVAIEALGWVGEQPRKRGKPRNAERAKRVKHAAKMVVAMRENLVEETGRIRGHAQKALQTVAEIYGVSCETLFNLVNRKKADRRRR